MKPPNKFSDLFSVSVILITLLPGFAGTVRAADDWQEKMLYAPPPSQIELEKRGRIMIYDGLTDAQVARAMDTQFDRIESMMFVGTVVTDTRGEALRDAGTGEVLVEDDGC